MSIVFGPIPSRRLGRSLGVNNIPPKICSYSCVYCQVGLTDSMSIERREFYPLEEIVTEISERVEQLKNSAERIDYITFVPDGEPTLDINIGKAIQLIKPLGIKIAVITNSSLLWDKEVRDDLLLADWVSVKIDTTDERSWHKINRPYGKLDLQRVLNGVKLFRNSFKGTLVTETMLVKGLNDSKESLTNTAEFIGKLNPNKAYILVPTRPPAEKFVEPPSEENLNIAYQIFNSIISNVEFLTGGEGSDFTYSSDVEKELLDILAVHPMKKEAVEIFLNKAGTDWSLIEELINKNILKEVPYSAATFIIKNVLVESKI
ncbi:MAG: radical SAM protein [Ignavibacteriaceae bacterium]|nr:radical SAM protein [Ignavibacteriaceae bacterium]